MERGPVIWEYRPPAAHPIVWAGLLLSAAVFVLGGLENLLRDNKPSLYAVYAAPPLALLIVFFLLRATPLRIHENGVAPSRPAIMRWHRPFIAWTDVAAAYPIHYDVTGAFVSPFASSDGKVTLTGIGLEMPNGAIESLRMTPTRFAQNTRRSRGYREAWPIVQARFDALGKPLVPAAPLYSGDERARLEAEAKAPFLPFFAIVFLFACAAPVLAILVKFGVPVFIALPVCTIPPLATSLRSYRQSQRRNRILNALSKSAQFQTAQMTAATPTRPAILEPAAEATA